MIESTAILLFFNLQSKIVVRALFKIFETLSLILKRAKKMIFIIGTKNSSKKFKPLDKIVNKFNESERTQNLN